MGCTSVQIWWIFAPPIHTSSRTDVQLGLRWSPRENHDVERCVVFERIARPNPSNLYTVFIFICLFHHRLEATKHLNNCEGRTCKREQIGANALCQRRPPFYAPRIFAMSFYRYNRLRTDNTTIGYQ
jgi:hypothetical protein